jgi:hypothetical protein
MKTFDQKGQALIELVVFLPLMVGIYSVVNSFANSINGSINQQKIARAYFYNRIQNNSTIPGTKISDPGTIAGWQSFGMFYIGWKEKFEGGADEEGNPIMPCYRINLPLKGAPTDECEKEYSEARTLWVRVGSVYGVCGATYVKRSGRTFLAPEVRDANGSSFQRVIDKTSCLIQ